MGTLILIVALVVEAAFATYCITSRSSQRRLRSFLRVGALAAFILLAVVSIIEWGFRWTLLAALLLIWATLGAVALIRRKDDTRPFSAGRSVGNAILTLLLVGIAVTPALIFPQFTLPRPTGSHPVATATFTYTDPGRVETFTNTGEHREVNVEFWYPQDGGGPYPLVVFSHGTAGTKTSNTSTFIDLASNGYVVCSIDHPYHALFTVDEAGQTTRVDPGYLQEYLDLNSGKLDEAAAFKVEQKWMALRTADINFTLDTILAKVKDGGSGGVYRLIDPGKIGLIGHSMGGAATAQVARERSDISAEVNLDADLFGEYLDYSDGKYTLNDKPYPVPILTIFSDDLASRLAVIKDADQVVAVKHVTATAPAAFEIHIQGTNHMSLTDLPLASPFLVSLIKSAVHIGGGPEADPSAVIQEMNGVVLKFFNAYLTGEGGFRTE